MYTDFFSLTEKPFSITPDPAFLFLSKRHEEALAHLLYGVTDSGGFIQLTGEVGTGKTIIIRSLFEQMPGDIEIALILNPRLSVNEFLHSICDELHLEVELDASNKDCVDALNPYLLNAYAEGRKVVILVDEAQNLSVEVLEQIRLLTNLETHKDKLLQIILVGQPELKTLLQRHDLRQLAQRITARYYLKPLNKQETRAYINHRLSVAGAKYHIFKPRAESLIFKATKGIPRLVNVVCDRALLGAFSQQVPTIDAGVAKNAIKEVLGNATVLMNDERTAREKEFSLVNLIWAPALMLLAFSLSQLPFIKELFDNPRVTQAHSQNIEASESLESSGQPSMTKSILAKQGLTTPEILSEKDQPTEPYSISLEKLLNEHAEHTTVESAFNQLLLIWGRSRFYDHTNACDNLKVLGLRCLLKSGQWADILKLNRPAILELVDAESTLHQLLLISIEEERAIIGLDSGVYSVPLSEVMVLWQGSYMIFWQPERLDTMSLSFGMNSEAISWLREQLTSLSLDAGDSGRKTLFDAYLLDAVKRFQVSQGIQADGIVGPETFLVLNNALKLSGRPTLRQDD